MRHDYIYNSPPDPKADDALAKFFAVLFWLVLGLVAIVYVATVVRDWFNTAIAWITETTSFIASFFPFESSSLLDELAYILQVYALAYISG